MHSAEAATATHHLYITIIIMLDYVDVNEAMHSSSASDASLTLAHLSIKPSSRLRSPLVFDGPLFYHFSVISKLLASKHSVENPYFWQQAAAHANKPL